MRIKRLAPGRYAVGGLTIEQLSPGSWAVRLNGITAITLPSYRRAAEYAIEWANTRGG
jgi:hypothetical protein